ncbi:hypothetical protein NIES267_38280 [Calothrix parasitica NIES-267]|uniref:Inosine/uridine-preferring nucleoside hydrolase domain-containing protein n=1 Tax=Calothrix parasitica NIES-267 TaxID=1973488 RepID=A0A1Z4LSX5_9CYAN|nr:hypothetical protein NIES267_38280 [Calothrix parasitica NIES-267]
MSQDSNVSVNPIPLIFDDDGSQDGMTALAYMLANPKFDIQAITIANGIARTEVFDDNIKRMLGRLGDTDIPVGVGRSTPLSGDNEFPDFIRDGSDTFWSPFVTLPEEVLHIETKPAVDLIIETIKNSPEPVAILATGPLTNIAEALRQDPSIIDNISILQVMGGAVFVPGNLPVLPDPPFSTNETAEFNIWVDPVAAQEVFEFGEKGLKIQLTPLDATNQIEFDRQDYQEWLETGTPESLIAAELLDFALTVIQSDNDPNPVWDLVAAVNLSEPDFSSETPLHIDVDTESAPGENQGQTFAVPGLNPNVLVSLDPNFDNIKFDAGEVFSYVELPVVGFSVDRTTIVEGGEAQILTFNLSEPAPSGGLVVNIRVDDPDGDSGPGDTTFPPEFITNITDFGQVEEDGIITASLTIAEGSSEATFGVVAFEDDLVEVGETYSFTLLEDENYIVATGSTTITTTIEDNMTLPTVSFSADRTVVSEGGEAQLITFNLSEPAPSGGLAIKLRIDDPDGEPGDTENALELFSNVIDFNDRVEGDIFVANITIAEGATEATIGIKALTDNKEEGAETYSLTLLENENYIVDSASTTITTTIEEVVIPTVSFFPEILISTEGDSFVWNFSLDKPVPEGGLTLNIVITQNTESGAGDASFNFEASSGITDFDFLFGENDILLGFTVGLAEGVTEAKLVGDTSVDGIPETDEIGLYTIADGENYRANPNQNSLTTIFTDRTVVTLTPEQVNVAEGDTFAWNFSLNRPAPEGGLTLSLPITLNNDPEPGDVEYNVEGSTNISDFGFITENDVSVGFTLTIPEGETVAKLVSRAVVDDIAEFDEIFTTVLADGNDYVANPVSNQVVTTIVEDGEAPSSSAPIVSIAPSTLISTEGDTFAWDFSLDKPVPSGGLTLNLPITQNNDPEPGDVIYNVEGSTGITDFDFIVEDNISIGFSVTLEEGVTSATLVSEAVADDNDLEELADEIFTTVLADGVDYRANPDSNEVQTILTREPVVSLNTEQVNVTEGGTFAWNFSLNKPAPEGGLTLSLPITFNNDPEPGDVIYNVEGSTNITDFSFLVIDNISLGFNLTIAEGATEATLVSQAVADDIAEIDEIFTTVLNDGVGYRANPLSKEVVTTIFETDLGGSSIAIENPGFEIPQLPENQFTQTSLGEFLPGWKVFDPDALVGENITDVGAYNPIANVFPSEAPEGENTAYAYSQAPVGSGIFGLTQTLDTQLKANTKYSLQVEVGNAAENDPNDGFNYGGFPGYRVELLAGGKVLARDDNSLSIAEGEFATSTVNFTATDTEPFLGQDLGIRLVNLLGDSGEDVEFDNVKLFAETVEPVLPTLSLNAEPTNVNEGEQLKFNFNLTEAAPTGGLTVNLDLVEDTDPLPGDITYFVEGSENITDFNLIVDDETGLIDGATVTIAEGATSATLLNDIIADNNTEGSESVKFGLADGDYSIDGEDNAASFTIVDTSTDLPTLSLNAEPTNVNEGEQLKFNFELTEAAPTGGLTVNLDLVEDTDPLPGDITYFVEGSENITDFNLIVNEDTGLIDGATVKIAEGATSATLLNDIIADNNTEGPESVKFGLASGNYSIDSDENAASFTIVDTSTDLPTLSLNAEPTNVNEGEQLKFNFELTEAAPSGGLTVNLDLVEDTDPLPGDITYFVEGSENITDFNLIVNDDTGLIDGATVTIAEGATSATLLNDIIADNNTEGPESVKFGLASGNYSIDSDENAASFTIIDTSLSNEISGTTKDDNLYGTNAAEIISGGRGDDNIAGNGGMDTLIGGRGDDDIYGGFEADVIEGGRGDDFIFGNGGNDLIDSGLGFDTVFLGAGEATVILDKGEGFDTIFNFQLGSTKLEISSLDNLNFTNGDSGAEIFLQGDKLAVIAGQSANTFSSNQEMIFAV